MKNQTGFRLSAFTASLALLSGSAWAQTQTTATTGVVLSQSALSVNDSSANGIPTGSLVTNSANVTRSQFNANTGVLTGVSANLNATAETTALTLNTNGNALATGSVVTTWSLGGSNSAVLNSTSRNSNGTTNDRTWENSSISASAANLNAFVGAGNVANYTFSTQVLADKTGGGNGGSATASITNSPLNAVHSLTYTYVSHANASFAAFSDVNALAYDFGNVGSNTSVNHSFNVFSLTGIGLGNSLVSISRLGGSGPNIFSVTGGSVGALSSASFMATLNAQNPLVLTNYSETYRITFADNTSTLTAFASNSVRQNYIDITLTAAVPEPGTYAMILAGLGTIGFVIRRRRPRA
jgi:hypothetical protein